ncbi:MAG: hypothetical protein IPK76_25725 [Lewinellaceae bacterium]|jgi:hypothetical protein|nr:hypothetical protein [Lewinellaceae bacterium]
MRIIGNIEHPHLKISVFRSDNRISIKFENALYEQTYKLGLDERFATMEAIQKLVDDIFLEQVSGQFQLMHRAKTAACARLFPPNDKLELEHII